MTRERIKLSVNEAFVSAEAAVAQAIEDAEFIDDAEFAGFIWRAHNHGRGLHSSTSQLNLSRFFITDATVVVHFSA